MLDIKKDVEELGVVMQRIKELQEIERKIKNELIARGVGSYAGLSFEAEVQQYDRATISPTLVRELADKEFVSAVTEVKTINAVVLKPL
jgi:PHP family Zn ribbon phosphoesterase